uniref:Uncharacterized protein n=1 Tax=Brassica campestris TaxID=3711 RepID=A0A3P5Z066_BRACM|nr:unnamed protein product [Brassica rapa]
MTSSPFTLSSSSPNRRTRLRGEGGRRRRTEEASRRKVMCIWISCVFAD